MNITINRMEMLDTARRMASIAPADSPLDVLHGVLLEADAGSGRLALTATSLELALMEQLPCTAVESGTFAIDAQMLTGMVEKLPEDTVEIIHPEGGAAVTLRSGCAHYTVPIWPRSSFPKPEIPFPEDTVQVSGIPDMAKRTVFAVSTENDKPLMRCVNLMFTPQGLQAAGSDGNCIVTARGDTQSVGNISLLIPASSLAKLARITDNDVEFHVGTTGKSIVFFKENFLFSARLMEGSYINTNQLLTAIRNGFTVLTDILDLKSALSSVLCVGAEGKVSLSFDGPALTFYCQGTNASATAPIEVIPLTGNPQGEYWYSAKKLAACLRALSGNVTLGVSQNGMLTLNTQDAIYVQSAMRPPAENAAPAKAA